MNKNLLFLTIPFWLSSLSSQAALKFTYQEVINQTIAQNLEIKAATEALESAKYNKKSSQSTFLPKATASLSYDKVSNQAIGANTITTDSYAGSLNLSQNLFNGFQDSSNLQIAKSKILTEQASLQETKAQISYDLKSAIANYFFAKDSLILSRDIKRRREDNLRMVELRFESGRENKGSVLLSKAYLEQAKLDNEKAENAMTTSTAFLKRILNLDETMSIELTEVPKVMEIEKVEPDYNAIIGETPTAKKFKATLEIAQANLESSRSGFYPAWDINGSVGKTGNDFFPDNNKRWSVGTTLTWSLFDGGRDFYATNSSSLIVKASERRLQNQNLELKRILKESFTAFSEALTTVKVSSAFLEAAKVRADIARSKYNNGLTDFDDWDLIENELITRQKDYTIKIRDRLVAEAAWEKSRGTGVIP